MAGPRCRGESRIWRGPSSAECGGLTLEQIQDELLNGRDHSKKGSRKRQL